jgi:putative DNA primase/helicase
LVRCFAGCDQQQVIEALKQRGLWARCTPPSRRHAPQPAAAKERRTTKPWAARLWAETIAPANTLTDFYLQARGISCAIPPTIRHHRALLYRHEEEVLGRFPAMVAAVTDLITGKLTGVQRIWLSPAIDADPVGKLWRRAHNGELLKAKKALGDIDGNGVLLGNLSMRHAVFVGEGIETTLSAVSLTGRAGVAAVWAENMPKLRLPPTARLIYVLVDADPTGEQAARVAAKRWHREGRRVRLVEVA